MSQIRRLQTAVFQVATVVSLVVLTACGGGTKVDPILQLSTPEALERGKALMADKKYLRAQRFLEHAFEASPNSREGREALLLAADALYLAGSTENYIRCEAKYRDFLNRFPTSDRSDYAQYQIANCLAERIEKPDRDQQATRKALNAYEELFRLYPTSDYVAEARTRATDVLANLSESELVVGEFYLRYRLCKAAVNRLEGLPEAYPNDPALDRILFSLGRAYAMCGESEKADTTFERLRADFPSSEWTGKIEGAQKEASKLASKADKRRQELEKKAAKVKG